MALGYTTPLTSTVNAMRGSVPLAIQVASAGVPTALPTGAVLYYGIKQPSAIKNDWLAKCQLTASTDPGSPGLWTGTLLLNTPEMRAAMHADPADPIPESLTLGCLAEVYYTIPGQIDPVLALNFNFSVGAPLYNGTEGMAPSPNPPYPPPDQVDTIALRNTAIAAAIAALPPGSPAVPHAVVTANADKLALTGLTGGEIVVISGEGNRVEQFVPTGASGASRVLVSGAEIAAVNGSYTAVGVQGTNGYYKDDGSNYLIFSNGPDPTTSGWTLYDPSFNDLYDGTRAASPAESVWTVGSSGTAPVPTVVTDDNPAAADGNWLVLENTVNLTVNNSSYSSQTIKDVLCAPNTSTNVGWVDPLNIPVAFNGAGISSVYYGSGAIGYYPSLGSDVDPYTGNVALLIQVPDRQNDVEISLESVGG